MTTPKAGKLSWRSASRYSPGPSPSGPHTRGVQRHAPGAPHQKRFKRNHFRRVARIKLGALSKQTIAQAPLQGSEALPLQSVDRITGWVRLRDGAAGELLAPIVV